MITNRRNIRACILLVFAAFLLVAGSGTAQASHKDDEIIVCTGPDNCFPQGDSSDDPSGSDASGVISYGSGDPTPPSTAVTAPTVTNPQAVTVPTKTTSGAVTAEPTTTAVSPKPPPVCSNLPELTAVPATMDRNASTGACTPKCLNHPDFTYLADRWSKAADGNCYYRGEDNYGLCKGDEYKLAAYSSVDNLLKSGYGMGIIVDTPDPNYRLNCLISDVATYRMDPKDFVFSGKYVQDGWPKDFQEFDTPLPYPWSGWKPLYPLWVQKSAASQYVAGQSTESIMAYGLLWYGGNRYQNAVAFAKYLKKNKTSWRSWKKQNPSFASLLVVHQRLLRRR